jgi:hypothetical protein
MSFFKNISIIIYVKKLPYYSGISIYPFIFIEKKKKTFGLLKHEYIHFLQQKRTFFLIFWIRYLLQNLLVGYNLNVYELEASGKIKPHYKLKKK